MNDKEIIDAFNALVMRAEKENKGLGYNYDDFQKDMPMFKKLNDLRRWIHEQRNNPILSDLLYWAAYQQKFPILKMLIREGVKPEQLDMPGANPSDLESLAWTTLITAHPNNHSNLDFLKLIVDNYPINKKGLTYLLWLLSQSGENESDATSFLVSKGAVRNADLIKDFPPFVIKKFIPKFPDLKAA